jgi:hypothetical protein
MAVREGPKAVRIAPTLDEVSGAEFTWVVFSKCRKDGAVILSFADWELFFELEFGVAKKGVLCFLTNIQVI